MGEAGVIRYCSYCKAEEHQIRPVGNFKVELQEVVVSDEAKLVCQSCRRKVQEVREALGSIGFNNSPGS